MIKVENIETMGWRGALRGMRNPLNSWEKSDTRFWGDERGELITSTEAMIIGPNDLSLMQRLYKGGTEHRKYLRQIMVSMDITAPIYWISEFDTYKIGTTRNSCSFMHKGVSKPFDIHDFSVHDARIYEILSPLPSVEALKYNITPKQANNIISGQPTDDQNLFMLCYTWENIISTLNELREQYLATKDETVFQQIRCLLPSGYNQKFTVTMNYENVFNMIHQRSAHRLAEWVEFCKILKELPYIVAIDPSLAMHESGEN